MYILIAIVFIIIFLIFTPIKTFFLVSMRQYSYYIEFGFIFFTFKINIFKVKKKKEKKKKKKGKIIELKNIEIDLNLKIYIPIEAYSYIYVPSIVEIAEISKFFIKASSKKINYKILTSYETFMLKGILTVSIWNIIKAILKSR